MRRIAVNKRNGHLPDQLLVQRLKHGFLRGYPHKRIFGNLHLAAGFTDLLAKACHFFNIESLIVKQYQALGILYPL